MKSIARVLTSAVAITAASAYAQAPEFPQQPSYSENAYEQQQAAYQDRGTASNIPQQELDAILAPIALYPDELLSQLLMAATFPQDVAQAAQWSRANPGMKGDEAVRAVDNQPWAPAVKSMVAFPDVLKAMGEQPEWTRKLGEAFLASEGNVLQTVQGLRQRADKAGNLRTSEQLAVNHEGENYALSSPSPETTYVPYYDPRTAYGDWAYPEYPPVYWNPWPGYAYYGGWALGWGAGIYVGTGFYYGGFNWGHYGHHYVHYSGHRPYYWHGNDYYRGWRNDRRDGRTWNTNGNGSAWNGRDRNPGNGNGTWNRGGGNQGNGNWNRGQGRGNGSWSPPQRQEGWQNVQRQVRLQEGTQAVRTYNPSVRTVAPRYGLEGGGRVVRPTQVQGAPVQRVPTVRDYTPRQQSAPASKPMPMRSAPAPAAQAAQRSFQPQHAGGERHGGGERHAGGERHGGGNPGGNPGGGNNGGGNRGRDR
jgi:hypothetical protein